MNGPGRLAYHAFTTQGGSEWLLRLGTQGGRPLLVLPPLLEEMNRTRALIAGVMRRLAGFGYDCWLPDLPGTGESARALEQCRWDDWAAAVAEAAMHVEAAAGRLAGVASFRGGALLDDAVESPCFWRFAPPAGASLVRDLERSSLVTAGPGASGSGPVLAGYAFSGDLLETLRNANVQAVSPLRTVRLSTDPGDADVKVDGPALWRRSEPGNSPALAEAIAADIHAWASECAAS